MIRLFERDVKNLSLFNVYTGAKVRKRIEIS